MNAPNKPAPDNLVPPIVNNNNASYDNILQQLQGGNAVRYVSCI